MFHFATVMGATETTRERSPHHVINTSNCSTSTMKVLQGCGLMAVCQQHASRMSCCISDILHNHRQDGAQIGHGQRLPGKGSHLFRCGLLFPLWCGHFRACSGYEASSATCAILSCLVTAPGDCSAQLQSADEAHTSDPSQHCDILGQWRRVRRSEAEPIH